LEDDLAPVCSLKYCPTAIKNRYFNLDTARADDEQMSSIIRQIRMGKTRLETIPYTLEIASSGACNLNCIMCRSNNKQTRRDDYLDTHIFSALLPRVLPDISELILSGFGDPLFNKHSRAFLQDLDAGRYPGLRINLLTNGMLFTEKLWDSIKKNKYGWISVSVDASRESTYEYIRRNGSWKVLQRNLSLIKELRSRSFFKSFRISFIVMKSNYMEIKDFAELGLRYECDSVVFQKMYGNVNLKENINFTKNKRIMIAVARLLTDPVFMKKQLDTTLINDYGRYAAAKVNIVDNLYSLMAESIFHPFSALVHYICARFPFLYFYVYRVYQFLKTIKIIPKMCKIKHADKI
jgi:MoaA/NifB/PqqE/SkfB family radical SAM enzyme